MILTADKATTRFLARLITNNFDTSLSSRRSRCTKAMRSSVEIQKADGTKCERCWNYSTARRRICRYPTVCERCIEALIEIRAAADAA